MTQRLLLIGFVLSAGALHASAQTSVETGLAAEGRGRWDEAAQVYRAVLADDPGRADLWVRVADIEAHRGNLDACVEALRNAIRATPRDPSLYRRLSEAYASGNQPAAASDAIAAALTLRPDDAELLQADAVLATWRGDYRRAARRYRQLIDRRGSDADVLLALARVSAWAGETDDAVRAYRGYLDVRGENADVWLELVRTESWRGNYGAALDVLGAYRGRFGDTEAYARELAAVSARSGRPARAIDLAERLLTRDPSSYDLNVTRAIALAMQRRPRRAFDALDVVRRLDPTAAGTQSTERVVRMLLGPTVRPGFSFYSDSDQLTIQRFAPAASILLASGTHVSAGYERAVLRAPQRTGLGRADNRSAVYDERWAEVGQQFGPVTLAARIGSAGTEGHRLTPYAASIQIRASDALTIAAEQSAGFVVISPRTLDIGLTQHRTHVAAEWDGAARDHVSIDGVYQRFSDGNARWELTVAPRRALARTERLNLDAGVSAYALGTTRDLPDGYYDPRWYQNYAAVVYPYVKVTENVGLGMSIGAGVQRDARAESFHFGGNATADFTVGIYRAWVLKLSAAATNNRRAGSGAFQGYGGSAELIRRF